MMKCNKCGHNDALALFSSVLCVNSACDFYDEGYAIEKGYEKEIECEPDEVEVSVFLGQADETGIQAGNSTEIAGPIGGFSIIVVADDDKRCRRTGNPCGSDTWIIGIPCDCEPCQKWLSVNENPWDKLELGQLELGQLDFSDYLYDWNNPYTWTIDNIPTWPGIITPTPNWIYYPSTTVDFSNISITSDCTITFNIV